MGKGLAPLTAGSESLVAVSICPSSKWGGGSGSEGFTRHGPRPEVARSHGRRQTRTWARAAGMPGAPALQEASRVGVRGRFRSSPSLGLPLTTTGNPGGLAGAAGIGSRP